MEIKEGWVVVIAAVTFCMGLLIGYAATLDSVAGDCKTIHGFHHDKITYECTSKTGDDRAG